MTTTARRQRIGIGIAALILTGGVGGGLALANSGGDSDFAASPEPPGKHLFAERADSGNSQPGEAREGRGDREGREDGADRDDREREDETDRQKPQGGAEATTESCDLTVREGTWQAGHYSENSLVPSGHGRTDAGAEAQCLLNAMGYEAGDVDGVFGAESQRAMRSFQQDINAFYKEQRVAVDGLPGEESWPYLRTDGY